MSFPLAITVYRSYVDMERCLQAVWRSTLLPDTVLIADSTEVPEQLLFNEARPVEVWQPGRNVGCASLWNRALRNATGPVIIANADTEPAPECFAEMMRVSAEHPEDLFFYAGTGNKVQPWSLFLQQPELTRRVGTYDGQFWPACYEDEDYKHRMKLLGFSPVRVPTALYLHHQGGANRSLTGSERKIREACHVANGERYLAKWGGPPGHETFKTAYNQGY